MVPLPASQSARFLDSGQEKTQIAKRIAVFAGRPWPECMARCLRCKIYPVVIICIICWLVPEAHEIFGPCISFPSNRFPSQEVFVRVYPSFAPFLWDLEITNCEAPSSSKKKKKKKIQVMFFFRSSAPHNKNKFRTKYPRLLELSTILPAGIMRI